MQLKDYPQAHPYILYGGDRVLWEGKIQIVPINKFFKESIAILKK